MHLTYFQANSFDFAFVFSKANEMTSVEVMRAPTE